MIDNKLAPEVYMKRLFTKHERLAIFVDAPTTPTFERDKQEYATRQCTLTAVLHTVNGSEIMDWKRYKFLG